MLPLRRILLPLTIPHGIIRRASETIAARVRTVAGIAETVAIAAAIADAGGEVAGDAGAAEAAIAADVTPVRRAQFASLEIRFAAGRTRFAWL